MGKRNIKNISRKQLGKLFHQGVLILTLCAFIWSTLNSVKFLMSIYHAIVVYLIGSILVFVIEIILLRAQQWSAAEENRIKREKAEAEAAEAYAAYQAQLESENSEENQETPNPDKTFETGAGM